MVPVKGCRMGNSGLAALSLIGTQGWRRAARSNKEMVPY